MTGSDSRQKKIRVAICGGGIGGLCLTVSLAGHSHLDVQLYEAAGQFKEIGAGVMIWARTWRILEKMGLTSAFSKIAHSPPTGDQGIGFDFRRSDTPDEGFHFKLVKMPYGVLHSISRAEFLDIFVNHLPAGVAHFSKRLASYSQASSTGPIGLSFTDGTNASCDILVGADGIKSCIRAQMYRETADAEQDATLLRYVQPIWTGTMAYRGLIKVQDIPQDKNGELHRTIGAPMMYCGKSKHVVSYSISQGDIVNVVTVASHPEQHGQPFEREWVENCDPQQLLACYSGWEPEVERLLRCIANPTRWAIHHLLPLPFYHKPGVVLMGDSAHAMFPHQGAGAGQAIEDAFVLAALLAKATSNNLFRLLDAYQATRLPAANDVLTESYQSGMMYEFDSEYGDDYHSLGPAIQRQWDWIDRVSLEDEVASAFQLAREQPSKLSSHAIVRLCQSEYTVIVGRADLKKRWEEIVERLSEDHDWWFHAHDFPHADDFLREFR